MINSRLSSYGLIYFEFPPIPIGAPWLFIAVGFDFWTEISAL